MGWDAGEAHNEEGKCRSFSAVLTLKRLTAVDYIQAFKAPFVLNGGMAIGHVSSSTLTRVPWPVVNLKGTWLSTASFKRLIFEVNLHLNIHSQKGRIHRAAEMVHMYTFKKACR